MNKLTTKEIKERLRNAAELSPGEVIELMAMLHKQPVWLPQNEIENMLKKTAQERYVYSVKRIAEQELAWTLQENKTMVFTKDEDGNTFFPIWPYKEYALKCKTDEWEKCTLMKLPLDTLINETLSNFSKTGIKISVFIVPNELMSTTASAEDFLNNLLYECSKYE